MVVTALEPDRKDPRRVVVRCGRRVAARVDEKAIGALSLTVGAALDAVLLTELQSVENELDARDAGLRLLRVKARSRAEMINRLKAKGFDARIAERAAARLEGVGLIDDQALAADLTQREAQRGSSRRLVEAKLQARGVDAQPGPMDDEATALSEARAKLASSRGLDCAAAARRVLAHLARRGFDEDAAREATERAMRDLGLDLPGE